MSRMHGDCAITAASEVSVCPGEVTKATPASIRAGAEAVNEQFDGRLVGRGGQWRPSCGDGLWVLRDLQMGELGRHAMGTFEALT